jgi:hypothetical protein
VRCLTKKADKAKFDFESGLQYWSKDNKNLTHEEFIEFAKDINATIPLER